MHLFPVGFPAQTPAQLPRGGNSEFGDLCELEFHDWREHKILSLNQNTKWP